MADQKEEWEKTVEKMREDAQAREDARRAEEARAAELRAQEAEWLRRQQY
jgi:hypothetical protein